VNRAIGLAAILGLAAIGLAEPAKAGVEKLYILTCGEGVAGDISRWSPGVNEGKSMDFVDNCYLIKHSEGWFLWDTGIPDAVADMPNGLAPADPRSVTWHRPKKLAAQLEQLGVKPSDIKAMAISHTHPDHIGNVEMFPNVMLYVQKAEYEWPGANKTPRFKAEHPVTKLEGDRDVFGDGSIVILATPGHTPGHQSLRVQTASGAVVLAADCCYLKRTLDTLHLPATRYNREQMLATLLELRRMQGEGARIVYGHDPEFWKTVPQAPLPMA